MNITLPHLYEPRDYQMPLLKALDNGQKYAAIVWARRHGKDITCWNYAIKKAASVKMDVTYVYPTSEMGKNNLWEAKTNDGTEFMDFLPLELRRRRGIKDDGLNDTFKQVPLINGSIIRLASAERPDRLRGGNSKLYILSEYAEMDPAVLDIIEPVVEANGGQVLINFTPKGDNHAKGSWESWQKSPEWFTQLITAKDTNVFTADQLVRIRERIIDRFRQQGRSEVEAVAFFEQEYMCNFETPVIGSYFGEGMKRAQDEGRIRNVHYEVGIPVNTYWDLGIDDSMTIWFIQSVNGEIRIIDYLENSGEGITFYISEMQKKGYVYGDHYAPHDIQVRELTSGVSRLETAKKLGINFRVTPKVSLEDGIDAARRILNRCYFDQNKCARGISALKSYQKEWDDKNKKYKDHPLHNWASHGADAFRYFAVSFREKVRQIYNYNDRPILDETVGM